MVSLIGNNLNTYGLRDQILTRLHEAVPYFILAGVLLLIVLVFSVIKTIKAYSYRTAEWLLADNPNLHYRKALSLSREMVRGHKGQWFLLDLSFIGWYLLCFILAPFLFLTLPLVNVYRKATHAEFYAELRNQALAEQLITMEDIGFVKRQIGQNEGPVSATDFYANR